MTVERGMWTGTWKDRGWVVVNDVKSQCSFSNKPEQHRNLPKTECIQHAQPRLAANPVPDILHREKSMRMCTKLPWEQPKSSVGCVSPSPTYVPATGVEPWIGHAGAGPRGGKAGLEWRRNTHWHQNTIPLQSYVWGEDRPQGKPGDHELTYRLWDTTRLEERLGKDPKGFGNP